MTDDALSIRRAATAELPALWALTLRTDAHTTPPAPDT